MEISIFLYKKETKKLRINFIENALNKLNWVKDRLTQIKEQKEASTPLLSQKIFYEVHRLKGSGGTYGFYEISKINEDLLIFLRSPFNDKRSYFDEEVTGALNIIDSVKDYCPLLKKAFDATLVEKNKNQCKFQNSLLFISNDRKNFFLELEKHFIQQQKILFSTFGTKDIEFSLKLIKPDFVVIENNTDQSSIELIKQIKKINSKIKFIIKTDHIDQINQNKAKTDELDIIQILSNQISLKKQFKIIDQHLIQ